MPSGRPAGSALEAASRGVLAGALGGALAGALDYALAAGPARQFLPDGTGRLLPFLLTLYAAAGSLVALALGLVLSLLDRWTDLGPLRVDAFGDPAAAAARRERGRAATVPSGGRMVAHLLGAAAGLVAWGGMVYGVTLTALLRFHGKFLIAAFVGVSAAALVAAAVPIAFLVAAALSPLLRFGPRVRPTLRLPPGLAAPAWLAGLGVVAWGILRLVAALQQKPRMTPPLRALNAALWAPAIALLALLAAHVLARLLWSRRPAALPRPIAAYLRFTDRAGGTLLVVAGLLAGAATLAYAAYLPIARLLPLRPFLVAGAAAMVALVVAFQLGARPASRSLGLRLAWLGLPALLLAIALQAGRADRVRKAAVTHASVAAPILDGLRAAADLDRDGYSPLFGADCNDLDGEVHPGAFDWPDDGVDQNCNGHQATARTAERPPFPPLPDAIPRRPNVVMISIDALRADHVGAYGYPRPTTPRIDELARESVRFENAWAHSPSTRYSVPAILIGRYESTIAWGSPAVHWPPQVLPENRLLSEMLKDHGYHTGALLPAHYFDPAWGLTQGFDDYDNSLARLHQNPFGGDPARATGSSSKELADAGVAWIRRAAAAPEPFFLWMHFYDPHYLYERHPEVPSFGESDVDLYDGEVRFTDLHVGRVLDAIHEAGVWDKTVVILTADHGEGFGEHGVKQHGYHIYVQQNLVPLLVRVPGVPPRTVGEPVGHVDLFPSLLNLLRAPDEPQLLGRSLFDLMLGAGTPRLVFQEVDYEGPTSRKAVASRGYQLIGNVVPDGTFELYHLATDPAEEHDLFARGAGGEQRRLEAALGEWMDESALPPDFARRVTGNLSSAPIATPTLLGANVGGLLVVDGVDVKTPTVRPGATAEVDLVFHVPARMPEGWRLFTHAFSTGNQFVNLDHEPVEGFVPLARLRPGQWVRDRIQFTVPPTWPPGPLTIKIGLFRRGERAKATGPGADGDHVRAATILVER